MANVEKVSIALTPELAAMVRDVLETGEYATASELMRDALRDWKQQRLERARAVHEIGRHWDVGLSSGSPIDGEAVFEDLLRRFGAGADRP